MEQLISVRSLFKETDAYAGKQIKVGGWVRNLRASKNFGFINLSDGTFFSQVQVVYGSELANFNEISKLNIGAAVIVTGTLVLTPDAKQPFELQASEVFVEGPSTPDYPIQPKRHSMEYLRTVTHLRPRTNTFQAVFRVRSLIAYAIHKFFQDRGFVYAQTPIITASDCEGAGEMFQVTTLDLNNVPKTEDGQVDYSQDLWQCLHLWPYLPCGEFQHPAPRRRVLDGGAGDGLHRSERLYGYRRGHDQVYHPLCDGAVPSGDGLLQPVRG